MRNHKKNKKYLLIGLVVICIFLMLGLGYALLSQNLEIQGTGTITSDWNILITDIVTKEKSDTAMNVTDPTHSGTSATINAKFEVPGDFISYDITVANQGTLNAVLDSIKIKMKDQEVFLFEVEGIKSGEALNVDEEKTFTLTIRYNENITTTPDITNIDLSMDLDYLQEGNESNFAGADLPEMGDLGIQGIDIQAEETSLATTINATNAIKYYFSLDNDKWYEKTDKNYTFYDLKPNTEYTIYVKAEDVSGEVVFSSKTVKTDDKTKPNIQLSLGDNQKGENNWYQGLTIDSKITDNDQVKEALYCTTTETNCTPNEKLELTEGVGHVQFSSNSKGQKVCIKASDRKGNENTKCSNAYMIDGTEPTLTDITLTPEDDTMTITVNSNDKESGLYTYYYSKDGGQEYIESNDSNYTFTSLEEKDYLVSVYVKDKAGNESEPMAKSTTIRYASYCIHNDITNLSDCVLASETQNTNIEEAKKEVESKGTPNFRVTSPNIVYQEKHDTSTSVYETYTYHNIATSYTFNSSTGVYTLTNSVFTDPETLDFSSGQTYYTCTMSNTMCTTLYAITGVATSVDALGTKIYKMTKYDYRASVSSYDNSESGLYATTDEDGTSYYYRGAVAGNYVKLNSQYYRIIRVNGDGTLRIIYDGTTPHENGEVSSDRQVGKSSFNLYYSDNGYVGYMYGDVSQNVITEAENIWRYTSLSTTAKYYFGTSYSYDASKNEFALSGDVVTATLAEYGKKYNDKKYYTCFSSSQTETCQRLLRVQSYVGSAQMNVKSVENSSISYEQAHQNINNSAMKTYLENWYNNNLSSVDDKISKTAYFCNNRQISSKGDGTYKNTGYGITPTYYGYTRIYDWDGNATGPTLACPQANDKFTASTSTGNGKLTKPIGLITADEVNMAGGVSNSSNMSYYLYTGMDYWTMTPSLFSDTASVRELLVNSTGEINGWNYVTTQFGVRPVINLNTENLTFTGTGTMQDPYVIE